MLFAIKEFEHLFHICVSTCLKNQRLYYKNCCNIVAVLFEHLSPRACSSPPLPCDE